MEKSFSISPRILSHLGEDLIKNDSIAILELVKNSYDACARNCIVDFLYENEELVKIVISDDGLGMSKEIIEKVWLKIGTDFKFKNLVPNQCNRIPLGEKGIGRLGVHKLGNKITLISKSENSKEVSVFIDWNDLNKAKEISDFKIRIEENIVPTVFKDKIGTQITVEDLKSNWDRRELREVYRNINSLNSPFDDKNETFRVEVKSNSYIFEGLPDFSDIRDSALYFGHCKMDGNKIIEFSYEFKPWKTLDKIDKGRTKSLSELQKQETILVDTEGKEVNLDSSGVGPVDFNIIIFELGSHVFNYVNTEKKSIKDYLRENGGVRVYRDGVRVYNYGERDNDWLGLELKRLSRFAGRISNNMIIGSANLSRADSAALKEKSNREGFIENESYYSFINAVEYALSIIVRERNVDKEILTTLYKQHRAIEPVLADLNELIQFVNDKVEEKEVKDDILKYLSRINTQYIEVKEVLIKSANAGLNLSVVVHEIDKITGSLVGAIERNEKDRSITLSQRLEKIVRGYSALIKKSDIRYTPLSKIVETAIDNYEFRFLDHNINVISNWRESKLEAYLAEAEAISVLTNLLDNSIYWLKYARKTDRMISVYLTDQIKIDHVEYNSIIVSDNGPGFNIPPDVAIKPFMTGKPHNIGSGLGLHVANEMMKGMRGKLIFIDKYDIVLPSATKNNEMDKAIIALCFPKTK